MASISDLPLKYRLFLAAYPFRSVQPVPWVPPSKPLKECRVALVTTAAFYLPEQLPFDLDFRGGDPSYRILRVREPGGARSGALVTLRMGHRSAAFDPSGISSDYNVAMPVDRFLELEEEGVIGSLSSDALSFMGSITAPGRLQKMTAPEAASKLRSDGVDVAFLCPV